MSQKIFRDIVADVDTGTLLAGWLNDFRDALISGLSGPTRPPELKGGGMWVDTSDSANNIWTLKLWLEDSGIESSLLAINTQSGEVFLPSVAGTKADDVSVEAFGATDFGNVQAAIEALVEDIEGLGEDVGELGPALSDLTDEVGDIVRLPTVTAADDGKVATVDEDGNWIVKMPASGLPVVTAGDAGKVLTVDSSGNWVAKESEGGIKAVPDATARINLPAEEKYEDLFVIQSDNKTLWYWTEANGGEWKLFSEDCFDTVNCATPVLTIGKAQALGFKNTIKVTISWSGSVVTTTTPFGVEDYQNGAEITVVNTDKTGKAVQIKSNDGDRGVIGGDIWLSDYMQNATFKYLLPEKRWILKGRSN